MTDEPDGPNRPTLPDKTILTIPTDLRELYEHALAGDAAVCYWREHGPKNSRWIKPEAKNERPEATLEGLILRIASLEDGLRRVLLRL